MKRFLVVYKKSTYELYDQSPDPQPRAYSKLYQEDLLASHLRQKSNLEKVLQVLTKKGISFDSIYRADLKPIEGYQGVIAVGGDGTFLEVSRYIHNDIPLLGFNSDPQNSKGFYCTTDPSNFEEVIKHWETQPIKVLQRMEIEINGTKIPETVLNDVRISHTHPHATTLYEFSVGGKPVARNDLDFHHRNSGLLVSTAAGSTACMYQEGGEVMPLASQLLQARMLGVRERQSYFGKEVRIQVMTRKANLSVDGPHVNYTLTLGDQVVLRSGSPLYVVGDLEAKRNSFQ